MIFSLLIVGLFAAIMGALPPGASNLAVIKASIEENMRQSMKISYGAGLGEVLLALMAFYFGMAVQDFFTMNLWLQASIVIVLLLVGIFLIKPRKSSGKKKRKFKTKYLTGFILSFVNPPVLLFWIVVFSFLRNSVAISTNSLGLILFMTGVFIGKVAILYAYTRIGYKISTGNSRIKANLNPIIGSVLVFLSLFQGLKLLLV